MRGQATWRRRMQPMPARPSAIMARVEASGMAVTFRPARRNDERLPSALSMNVCDAGIWPSENVVMGERKSLCAWLRA